MIDEVTSVCDGEVVVMLSDNEYESKLDDELTIWVGGDGTVTIADEVLIRPGCEATPDADDIAGDGGLAVGDSERTVSCSDDSDDDTSCGSAMKSGRS